MKKYKAFTLLEVLVTSLVLGFLGVGAVFMIANSNRVLNAGVKMSMVNSNVQSIMMNISRDIKGGISMTTSEKENDLYINYSDSTEVRWFEKDGTLYRTDKNDKTQAILLYGAKDVSIDATFTPVKYAKYWKAEVEFTMHLNDGNTFEVGNVTNTYYCRLQEDGYVN